MGDLNIKFNPRNFQDLVTAPLSEANVALGNLAREVNTGVTAAGKEIGKVTEGIGSGLSQARTGLDQGARSVNKALNMTGGQILGGAASGIDTLIKNPSKAFKNVEQNLGDKVGDLAYAVNTGDWTSFVNRTLATGSSLGLANPEDITSMSDTKTGKQKISDKAAAQVAEATATAEANAAKTKLDAINTYMGQLVQSRKKTPGVSQTLLGQYNPNSASIITRGGR